MALVREKVALPPSPPDREIQTRDVATSLRRFSGPLADELYLLCRPIDADASVTRQAESVYGAVLDVLSSEGVGPEALVSETAFFRRGLQDSHALDDGRRAALGNEGLRAHRAAVTSIGQAPLGEPAHFELAAVAVVPHRRTSWSASDVSRSVACSCATCTAGVRGRMVRLGDQTQLYAGGIYGCGPAAFEEAYDMFRVAEGLLEKAGMTFRDVARTWIYVRDIDRDYDALNRARRAFFEHCGVELKPASTGVQGTPLPDAHDFALSLYALDSPHPLQISPMSSSTLNEAWTYGADFSRGLKVVEANKTALYVSGTASIGEAGQTVAVGDFAAQANRMILNIASLLEAEGATFEDLVSGVAYLKRASDAPALRRILRDRGFDHFPCALVEAPLCRPELLCETEVVAILPHGVTGA